FLYAILYASYAFHPRRLRWYVLGAVTGLTVGMIGSGPPFRILSWLCVAGAVVGCAVILGHVMAGLRWYATTDELTGAVTRHAAWMVLDAHLSAARRRGEPLSVAVVDLDDFKIINDSQGHAAGDRV